MKTKTLIALIISIFLIVPLVGCHISNLDEKPIAADDDDDEVLLVFNLDTQDEIYQVSMDYIVDGEKVGDAGTRNADGMPFSENDTIYHPFNLSADLDISNLSVQLYVADFINDFGAHKSEYKIENEIKLAAEYGNVYYITIAGDKKNGYTAFLKTTDQKAN